MPRLQPSRLVPILFASSLSFCSHPLPLPVARCPLPVALRPTLTTHLLPPPAQPSSPTFTLLPPSPSTHLLPPAVRSVAPSLQSRVLGPSSPLPRLQQPSTSSVNGSRLRLINTSICRLSVRRQSVRTPLVAPVLISQSRPTLPSSVIFRVRFIPPAIPFLFSPSSSSLSPPLGTTLSTLAALTDDGPYAAWSPTLHRTHPLQLPLSPSSPRPPPPCIPESLSALSSPQPRLSQPCRPEPFLPTPPLQLAVDPQPAASQLVVSPSAAAQNTAALQPVVASAINQHLPT
ncbi:hypothetical protein BC826DRAFT_1113807 [Russula brevipes]|nr:hypothetical protein BC826DRAFT_1113807 [Russula brevipes]